jgi:hypothetical protein
VWGAGPMRRANPAPGAERAQSPAPTEPNPRPSEPETRRRTNPSVRLSFGFVHFRASLRPTQPRRLAPPPRANPPPAPTEPNLSRRPNPISRADRTQSPRRANPSVRLRFMTVRLCGDRGRGCPTSDRPRPDFQRAPYIIEIPGPPVLPIRGGARDRLTTPRGPSRGWARGAGRPGAGMSARKRAHDRRGSGGARPCAEAQNRERHPSRIPGRHDRSATARGPFEDDRRGPMSDGPRAGLRMPNDGGSDAAARSGGSSTGSRLMPEGGRRAPSYS